MSNYQHIIKDGFEYYYRPSKNPNQQTIVFCHGYAAFYDYHNTFSDQLSDHDYYAIVLPGHGELPFKKEMLKVSYYAKHLADWILKLGLKTIILMGHSMGGAVVASATVLLPKDIVNKLIIVSPMNAASAWNGLKFITTFKPKPNNIHKFLYRFTKTLYFDGQIPYNNPINGNELLEKDTKYYKDHSQSFKILNHQMGSLKELKLITKNYKNLDLPTFLILGEKDWILPVKLTIKKLTKDIKNLTYSQLLQTAHLLFRERPIDYFNLVQDIIAEKTIKKIY